jgi:thiol-disulfide isomerase/thioredoxin
LIDGGDLSFNLKRLDGTLYSYPKNIAKNKVIIIQIMGTWCPNCLDETLFYKTLYDKYHDRGLEIISVAYEVGKNHDEYVKRVNKLKNKLDLNFTFLIGGQAKKELASTHFQALNQIISFPTSIFIDKKGDIVQIHTGFNGPGTGTYYSDYKRKTIMMLEYLLAQ